MKSKIIIQAVLIVETTDEEIETSPTGLACDDSSMLKKWFFHFCKTENPITPIIDYAFLFLETDQCYLIKLKSATRNYTDQSPGQESNSDFAYHTISKKEYAGLEEKNVLDNIESQLQKLKKTKEFAISRLSKVKHLTITFNDRHPIKLR